MSGFPHESRASDAVVGERDAPRPGGMPDEAGGSSQAAPSVDEAPGQGEATGWREASTGDPEVDAALQDLDDLADVPLEQHHERLAAAHERIHGVLDPDRAAGRA